jgi:hypothetical protein
MRTLAAAERCRRLDVGGRALPDIAWAASDAYAVFRLLACVALRVEGSVACSRLTPLRSLDLLAQVVGPATHVADAGPVSREVKQTRATNLRVPSREIG